MKPISVTKHVCFIMTLCLLCGLLDNGVGQETLKEAELITKFFPIPPDFAGNSHISDEQDPFTLPATSGSPATPDKPGILSRSKIPDWPPGAGSVIDRRANQIAIRNTEAFMKQLEPLIAKWNEDWQMRRKPVVYYDEVTFTVVSRRKVEALLEAIYQLPSTFTTPDLKAELDQQGVLFPEGSAARFDAKTRLVTIHNTKANIDLAVSWIASLWADSKEAPPFQDKAPFPVQVETGQVDQALRDLAAKILSTNK